MKKLLTILLLAIPAFVFAQTDTTKNLRHEQYCIITVKGKSFSTKLNISVDFGQETKFFDHTNLILTDKVGHLMEFNSTADALNYMATQGWLLVNTYPIGEGIINYVMRKPVESDFTANTKTR